MNNIYNLSLQDLENYFISINDKKYRALQIFTWLYIDRVDTFDKMSNLSKVLIDKLNRTFSINNIEIIFKEKDTDVVKYLFKLSDGEALEAVLMKHNYGNSLCISTQVGCNMGCSFCESGRRKKIRNLEVYEMVQQILKVEKDSNLRISHVVIMGIGEPFDNYDNLIKFIEIINHPKGISIGSRHITVSTCGIVPKIKEFSNLDYQVNLAISLHAPNDKLRTELMPINKSYPLKELISSLKDYVKKTNRRVTFEYIMLHGINDTIESSKELSSLVKGLNSYINLIPYNETSHIEYKRSSNENIQKFYDMLKKNNVNVTIRREFGSNISAACGQLRSKKEE